MSKGWRYLLTGGLVVVAMGCSSTGPRPPASNLQEGLTLLDAKDPTWGFNAAYVKQGRVIYVESRVGAPKPEIYRRSAPDDPANEMDIRFVDQKNLTFFVQRGGDSYIDPTWTEEIKNSLDPKLPQSERELDWAMAREAAQKFTQVAPASFKDHTFHLANFAAKPTPMENPELLARLAEFEQKAPRPTALPQHLQDQGYGTYDSYSWTQMYTAKYSGSTGCFAWICAARHSATIMYVNPNVGYWQQAIYANNHGRGAYDSGMGYDCYSWNGGGWYQYGVHLSGSTAGSATGNWDGQGGCQTGYNWNSGGYDHLCNDDAAYELWQGKGGGWTGWSNSGPQDNIDFKWYNGYYFSCNCGSFGGCSGDWNSPSCP